VGGMFRGRKKKSNLKIMSEKVTKEISPSKAVASKTIYEAFKILKNAGGELPGKT
jgi:hypothetical protein